MVFSSSLFLLYFLPIFLIFYFTAPQKARNYVALIGSTLFFAWGAPKFVFIVYGSLLIDFWLVAQMHRANLRRTLMFASVVLNVGLLGYFKYANFFVENFNSMLGASGLSPVNWTMVALPIGISFFTFQKLSYTLDVFKGKHAPLKEFGDYALYIILFPQLIAGPIVRFTEIADQLVDRTHQETIDNRLLGFFRFTIGLAKKVLIANAIGHVADSCFGLSDQSLTFSHAWVGLFAYSMQIYFDFSGYSDMAIGLGKMMGFTFPENFNSPYISSSITEFWQRWHMTLGRWMKDYLYIPLGGNRKSIGRTYFNLWVVFLISGLWHGASWNFVVWGAYHGFFLVLERLFLNDFYRKIGKVPSVAITFVVAILGWVVFRTETLSGAITYYKALFTFNQDFSLPDFGTEFYATMVLALIFSFMAASPKIGSLSKPVLHSSKLTVVGAIARTLTAILLFIFCVSMVNASGFNPFIYFQF